MSQAAPAPPLLPATEVDNTKHNNGSSVYDYYYRADTSYGGIIIAVMSAVGKLLTLQSEQ
jgi:hypothetical protein